MGVLLRQVPRADESRRGVEYRRAEEEGASVSISTSVSDTHSVLSCAMHWGHLFCRHMRRRAASHNLRRLPVRVRQRAKSQMHPKQLLKRVKPKWSVKENRRKRR